jgi:hypothetical protein
MSRISHFDAVLANIYSAREAPEDEFEGYLSMIITELNMSTLRQQNMLMCNEWFVSNTCMCDHSHANELDSCGIPLYANLTVAKCKHCDEEVSLRTNPRVVSKHSNYYNHS